MPHLLLINIAAFNGIPRSRGIPPARGIHQRTAFTSAWHSPARGIPPGPRQADSPFRTLWNRERNV